MGGSSGDEEFYVNVDGEWSKITRPFPELSFAEPEEGELLVGYGYLAKVHGRIMMFATIDEFFEYLDSWEE